MEITPKLKALFLTAGAVFMIAIFVVAFKFVPDDNISPVKIQTIPLPKDVTQPIYPHYTATGNIVFQYKNTSDSKIYVGVMNDDGSNFHIIYNGEPKPFYNNTNGVRLMPFKDNKRILLGDGIMECEPSIDEVTDPSTQTKIIPVEYPEKLLNLKNLFLLWSEIIISPDNVHMGWNSLLTSGTLVFISRLERQVSHSGESNFISPRIDITKNKNTPNNVKYVMKNIQLVSDLAYSFNDPDHPGFITAPKNIHGGEIKQFTFDCQKLTLVGSVPNGLARSVLQNLNDDSVTAISHEAGYEETTIISPNGKYGIAMSTRFSPKSSCKILGLIPRPHSSLNLMSMAQTAYYYSVTGVRNSRKGNVGPALIEMKKALSDSDFERKYHGVDLHDTAEEYVYRSPMSWHYTSQKVIWLENIRNDEHESRIRQAVLSKSSYPTGEQLVCEKETPDNVPYAQGIDAIDNMSFPLVGGKIASPLGVEKGGYIDFDYTMIHNTITYHHYTEDGVNFYDGSEAFTMDLQTGGSSYEGNVTMKDEKKNKVVGEMNFKITFEGVGAGLKLVRDKSYGQSTFNGETVTVDEMED